MALHPDIRPATGEPVNVLSLCSGGAGLDLGVMLAEPRARVVGFVEREAFAAAVLVARMADSVLCPAPVWDDVATFDGRPWRGTVDCVTAGFPCQPWSVAGRRRGAADERWIWTHIVRIIREVGPGIVFLENVPGIIGEGLAIVLGALASLGFDAEWGVLGADEVGAPHRRRRLFVLAYTDLGRWWPSTVSRRRQRENHTGEGTSGPRVGGGLLADSGRIGLPGVEQISDARWNHPAAAREPGAELADANGEGARFAANGPPERRWSPDLWPPAPDDLERWRDLLAQFPWIAPATQPVVRRVADGVADWMVESIRTARLQLLGNGVVPLVAALAWHVLLGRALAGPARDREALAAR